MRTREYSTDELLLIANNVTGEYTDKQVRQAKLELYNRGVDDKVIADIMEEKEEAFMRRLDAAARAEKARMDKQKIKNAERLPNLRKATSGVSRLVLESSGRIIQASKNSLQLSE